ncbi:FecR domain-containing protein, partial [Elizabethkingia meningoseptica]|uniref:FecR domain-containing protein n=1 Tax=Elizabethkingia meningoseptica TaxID=238 RepID=UPI00319C2893
STGVGEQRTVEWGGQAVVELDAHTRMNVSDGQRRLALLEGQAAISCPQAQQALTVSAGAGEMVVGGATVGLRRIGNSVTVTCLSGQVAIRHPRAELA